MYIQSLRLRQVKILNMLMDVQEGYNHFNGEEALAFLQGETQCSWRRQSERKRSAGGYYCYAEEVSVADYAFEGECDYGTGEQRC